VRQARAAVASAIFFALAPGVTAGVVPFWITGWQRASIPTLPLPRVFTGLGVLTLILGLVLLLSTFGRFVTEGSGTPAPAAPTERLVTGGPYRYVRNPMYVGVLACIIGQAIVFRSDVLLLYAVGLWGLFAAFARSYEEPTLARRYGDAYARYRRQVPAWIPSPRRPNPS
jgi:protein-S-isoprenylcysteine O-methyltransferase Ste14